MKAEIEKPIKFVPFSIIITFENSHDVREMWHRLNINSLTIERESSPGFWDPKMSDCYPVFSALDEEMKRRGIPS